MMGLIASLPMLAQIIIVTAAVVTAIGVIYKFVWKPIKSVFEKWNSAMDSLVGYPAIHDRSGTQLKAATPALANRVESLEEAFTIMANTQSKLLDLERDLASISDQLKQREQVGMEIIQEWTDWRKTHEEEAKAREERLAEWEQWRQEQTLLGSVIREHLADN